MSLTTVLGCSYITPMNKEVISEDFVRTRQLNKKQLEQVIKRENIQTILNLRGEHIGEQWFDDEKRIAEENDVQFYSLPFRANVFPSQEILLDLLDRLEEGSYPLLVHCQHGADRTGFASVIYRHNILKEPINKAKKELQMTHGHIKYYPLDYIIAVYEQSGAQDFRAWVNEKYSPEELEKTYKKKPIILGVLFN